MELKIMVIMIIAVVAVAFILLAVGNNMGAEYNEMATTVAGVCVPITFFGLVLAVLFDTKAPTGSCIIASGCGGILIAFILKNLYDGGVFVDSLLGTMTGATITDLMGVTVILAILIGVFFEVIRQH